MSGIYGNNLEDLYHESQLNEFTDREEEPELYQCKICEEKLEECFGDWSEKGYFFCNQCLDIENDYFIDLINSVHLHSASNKLNKETVEKLFKEHPELYLVTDKENLI